MHFEFIFVDGDRRYSNFIPLHIVDQFSHAADMGTARR